MNPTMHEYITMKLDHNYNSNSSETVAYKALLDEAERQRNLLFSASCPQKDKYANRQFWFNRSEVPVENFQKIGNCVNCKACGAMSNESTMLFHQIGCKYRIDPAKEPWLFVNHNYSV